MKDILPQAAGAASAELTVDFDLASVLSFPRDTLLGYDAMPPSLKGPVLSLPVDAELQAQVLADCGARNQVNAALIDGVAFPLIAAQAGDRAVACICEPADELVLEVFAAAQRRRWLPLCLASGTQAIVVSVVWSAQADDLFDLMRASKVLSVSDYTIGINAAVSAAKHLFLSQPPGQKPRHLAVRVLASRRRMEQTIESAIAAGVSLQRH